MNSMRMSIENRSPFLNKELLNFTMSLPVNFFIKNGYGRTVEENQLIAALAGVGRIVATFWITIG